MIAKTMNAVYLTGHGGIEKLEFRSDVPVPQYGPRDVLVKVAAAGVNNTDINTRTGWYSKQGAESADASWTGTSIGLPRIQGIDVCGRIVAVGDMISPQRICSRDPGLATATRYW